MSLIVFALLVILVLCLCMWVVTLLPFPPESPVYIKQIIMIVLLVFAILVIATRAGWLAV